MRYHNSAAANLTATSSRQEITSNGALNIKNNTMASEKNNEPEQTVVDNLNSHLTSAGEKVAGNKKIIFWCVGALCVVAAFVLSYLFIYKNPRLENSWSAYDKVQLMVQKGELASDTVAAREYAKVADNFTSTQAGEMAALSAAEAFYNIKKYDDAIKYLEKCDIDEPVLNTQAKVLLGDCYVNKKQYDKAIDAFQSAIKKAAGNPELVPLILIKEANVYDAQKKYDKALDCYTQIKQNFPSFSFDNGLSIDAYIERENARMGK